MSALPKLTRFNDNVLSKYQIYNSIFTTLPFDTIDDTGVLLPLLHKVCESGFKLEKNPTEIVEHFFKKYQENPTEKEKSDLLFRFIQFIERQVVLFDAIEDAAFPIVNNMDGFGTLRNSKETAFLSNKKDELKAHLEDFKVRIVLTAHPTQFYPGTILGIITDLDKAIQNDDLLLIKKLLAQLGKTPFYKKEKPTPFDEAVSLVWYLEHVFYHSVPKIYNYIQHHIYDGKPIDNEIIDLGFWPGGDRDGNPFVTTKITLDVAEKLRQTILRSYYRDVRRLKRRFTFDGVQDILARIEKRLYKHVVRSYSKVNFSQKILLEELYNARQIIVDKHQSLFVEELNDFINKVRIFGFHFATLDIRQDSRVHHKAFVQIVKDLQEQGDTTFPDNYLNLTAEEQINILSVIKGNIDPSILSDETSVKTIESIYALKEIQQRNGERGANRYIISNNQTALNVMETFAMLNLCGFENELPVDVIPLFETVEDLENAEEVMRILYNNKTYRYHLSKRKDKQTIMLGFSDGTKDGGYLMANWGIFKAKEALTRISREFDIEVIFFDGRGGPPARGGGKTHQFYASLGPTIEDKEIQLTIQGQTISSNFGTLNSSQYNLEQLISSGIKNEVFTKDQLNDHHREIIEDLASTSYQAYVDFKNHPQFLSYLEKMSTLKYYAKTNIGSRPSKRSNSDTLDFSALRAIPFVGSWSQLKQNVPGFFGVGTAFKKYEDEGRFDEIVDFYNASDFFKTLLENSMMSLTKSFFGLTAYMADDPVFGEFWKLIFEEYKTTKRLLLKLTGHKELMENFPVGKASIELRENIVLPLLTIQQYALKKIQDLQKEEGNEVEIEIYEKMVMRSLFGNINASRNSA
ncbi:phosphoenolpyruvate carboxylase [Polaribacter reichenbachii]|uniref:Phosphoenolpyruvate carboxylase n=1 Tax=Polaribacter reichenbachii TaxID=996801 RepID=A0A1B8U6F1_9FLAO|nr:phosphoenolpyruvate carboxylase [Polaribacter reichenbachii]APZ46138.1 phosphoenolpyruvate carboxylase [Polaribacter reichenbachii]AUC20000.1 phosphoenolpyruvate carboxylase [Polaribacter reichenbachii]OBY67454.1 phosphoenolpyruvate carboxylase [Polaribacter reichenbachii]